MRVSEEKTTIVIADPPWPHANGSRTNSGKSPKYKLMLLREIEELGETVRGISGDNSVLYMWATTPHLYGAMNVMLAWGFNHRSIHVWSKKKIACGFWARSNAEIVLIGERGKPAPPRILRATIFNGESEAPDHSSKPPVLHEIVESAWPSGKKVELFARRKRSGWDCIGYELGHLITASGVVAI
jgi:N6-adenosine-specific RNA methylase IME4